MPPTQKKKKKKLFTNMPLSQWQVYISFEGEKEFRDLSEGIVLYNNIPYLFFNSLF